MNNIEREESMADRVCRKGKGKGGGRSREERNKQRRREEGELKEEKGIEEGKGEGRV